MDDKSTLEVLYLRGRITRRQMLVGIGMLAAGMSISTVLAACTTSTPTKSTTSAIDANGEVVIWDSPGDLYQVADAAIPAFNAKYPNVKVMHQAVETATTTSAPKLPVALVTNVNVPDGAYLQNEQIGTIQDYLYDITDWIQPYVKDIVGFDLRVDTDARGRIKGIPYDADPAFLFYRDDIIKQHGLSVDGVQTYDDLLNLARQLRAKDPSMRPIRVENDPNVIVLWTSMFANQQGTSYVDSAGKLRLNSDAFLKILKFYKTVVDEGLGVPVTIASPDDIAASDKGVQVLAPTAIWFNFFVGNLFKDSRGKWRATRLPAWTSGGARAASMGGSSFLIPAKARRPDLAWLYYQFMMFDPQGYKAYFGPNKLYPGGINTLIPAYKGAWGTKLMDNPSSLGGQDLWSLATQAANDIPQNYYYPSWYSQMGDILGKNVQLMYAGKLTPQQVLQQSSDQITAQLMR
jgi:lactose/L-arabinose transport system substrate-binding protein